MAPTPALDATIRQAVFRHCFDDGSPPSVEALMNELRLGRSAVEEALNRLEASRHLKLVPGTHRVLMAFPFSAVATPYEVRLEDGRRFFANCAWDALAFHTMLRRPIDIRSFCYHCGDPIRLLVRDGRADSGSESRPVVYLGLPAAEWWKDIVNTCSNTMLFFANTAHLAEWRGAQPDARGAELTPEVMLRLSEPLYATKMDLDYSRPSRDQLLTTFRELGLTGEFWKI